MTFCRRRPSEGLVAVLERSMKRYCCLTVGDLVHVRLSTRRYPFVWGKGVLNGYSSTRVSLWDSLMFGRVLEY